MIDVRAVLVIAAKDLRQRLRDRSAIILAFVAPIALASIVTGAFGSGFGANGFSTSFVVLDLDRTPISRAFVDDVLGSDGIRAFAAVEEICADDTSCTATAVDEYLEREDAYAAFVIPADFGARATAGSVTAIGVVGHAEAPISQQVASSIAEGFTDRVAATRLAVFTAIRSGADASRIDTLAQLATERPVPVTVDVADPGTREVSGANYFGPSMAIFFVFFTVAFGASSLLTERAEGTLARLLAAPISHGSVLAGKALSVFALGLASMAVMFGFMSLVFGVDWGDPLAIGALTVLVVAAAMGVTAVVQTLAKTPEQAGAYGSVVGMGFALVGGNFFPLWQLPAVLQRLSLATPNGWALRGFTDIAYDGAGLGQLVPNVLALAAFAAVASGIALVRARRITVA